MNLLTARKIVILISTLLTLISCTSCNLTRLEELSPALTVTVSPVSQTPAPTPDAPENSPLSVYKANPAVTFDPAVEFEMPSEVENISFLWKSPDAFSGALTIANTDTFTPNILTTAKRLFEEHYPGVTVEIVNYYDGPSILTDEGYAFWREYQRTLEKRVSAELMGGGGCDIIDMSELRAYKLGANGLIEDLYSYLDNDNDMKREDFFPNILGAMEYEGKLYQIPQAFYYTLTRVNKKYKPIVDELLGDALSVSYLDVIACYDEVTRRENPEGLFASSHFFNRNSSGADPSGYRFLTFNFNRGDYFSPMSYKSAFGREFTEMFDKVSPYMAPKEKVFPTGSSVLFFQNRISNELYSHIKSGDPAFDGLYLQASEAGKIPFEAKTYGINAAGKNKAAAWEFIKLLCVNSDVRSSFNFEAKSPDFGFPARIKSYYSWVYDYDFSGYQNIKLKGEALEAAEKELFARTEQMNRALNYFDGFYSGDFEAMTNAEFTAYLDGMKTAEELAQSLENKLKLYINE